MWSLTKIIGLVIIPLMIGSAVLGSLQTMKTASVDEQYGMMDAILERENNRLYIDQTAIENATDSEYYHADHPGTEMFRDVIAVSQISAISCDRASDLISGRMIMTFVRHEDGGDRIGFKISDSLKNEIDGDFRKNPFYAIPGRNPQDLMLERAPNYALQFTGYTPRCVGVQRVESSLPSDKILTNPVGYVAGGTYDAIVSAPGDFWGAINCNRVPGWVKRSGNDMEGRYGRVPFKIDSNVEDPIILAVDKRGSLRRDYVWTANFINEEGEGDCWAGGAVGAVAAGGVAVGAAAFGTAAGANPVTGALMGAAAGTAVMTSNDWADFNVKVIPTLAGAGFARYTPYDLEVIEGDANWPGVGLKMGQVVVDAPAVLSESDEGYIEYGNVGNEDDREERGLRFQERAKYVLCPGTTGYIQTNREDNGRGGGEHVVGDDPSVSSSKMTTYIRVTGGDPDSCVTEGSDGESYVKITDDVRIRYWEGIDYGG